MVLARAFGTLILGALGIRGTFRTDALGIVGARGDDIIFGGLPRDIVLDAFEATDVAVDDDTGRRPAITL